jgi:hypothetical protein
MFRLTRTFSNDADCKRHVVINTYLHKSKRITRKGQTPAHDMLHKISRAQRQKESLCHTSVGSNAVFTIHYYYLPTVMETIMQDTHLSREDDPPIQVHFDVSHAPTHMRAEDGPNQTVTLTAALAPSVVNEDHAAGFHHQIKETKSLDLFGKLYDRGDKQRAVQLLTGRKEIQLEGSKHLSRHNDEDMAWQVESHYLDMYICVGSGLGIAAMLPNISVHHSVEFRLVLVKPFRCFSAKYAKLGFYPANCILWIGRSSCGEDSWLAWVPTECMGPDAEGVTPGSGKEDTRMSQKHYRIAAMFLSYMLCRIAHRDITVSKRYPDVDDDEEFRYATNAL